MGAGDGELHVGVYESCLAVVYFALILPKVHWQHPTVNEAGKCRRLMARKKGSRLAEHLSRF